MGYTQTDLAHALKLTFQQVQKYEKGNNRISASRLWEAASFLDVEVGYFFVGLPGGKETQESGGVDLKLSAPTRHSVEIVRLSQRLSAKQQKLALGLVSAMAGSEA